MAEERNTEVVETEQRQARWVLITTALGFLMTFGGLILQSSGLDQDADDAESLVQGADHFSTILAGSIIRGVGFILLSITALFLFNAAARRSKSVNPSLRPLIVIGGALIALSGVLSAIALDNVANDFIDSGGPLSGDEASDTANDLINDSTLRSYGTFAGLGGTAAFVFGLIYSAMWGMRVGLLTRFWGTLGMAFSASLLLVPQIGAIGVLFFLLHVALVARGRWAGGSLPAWEQGVAVPWPDPRAPVPEPEPEEAADPEDFEGTATEVPSERPGRRDNKRKRKRKQRG